MDGPFPAECIVVPRKHLEGLYFNDLSKYGIDSLDISYRPFMWTLFGNKDGSCLPSLTGIDVGTIWANIGYAFYFATTMNPSLIQALVWGVNGMIRSTLKLIDQEENEFSLCRQWLKMLTPTFPYGTVFLRILKTVYGPEISVIVFYHMITF
ncbi:uncharacterized protein EURHEDRAFT_82044 [Aspergillus ruber CBS 135680]|uniref:Uncharacterized protein n=1 Tax=Aspergillus ruber (strain CBS 135680) TaxID=1388766 RepID=A0A017SEK4_ASPRC|nr:uncharacterized protein EURHEDRAFT_82044 [Aspergillus ruber CBS 135680]EYE94670.1 hypothetical protein EURHEDRAFT_82044 [Aspergillus ruber CBS 135680]